MGRRGPKPAPTRLKLLQGVRSDRINATEPAPPAGLPDPPAVLGPIALAEWRRVLPILDEMGVVTPADGTALAMMCVHYERWHEAEAKLKSEGMVVETGSGSTKVSPYLTIAEASMREMGRILAEFGMTPSSRSRVSAVARPVEDELDAFLGRREDRRLGRDEA